MILGVLSDTHGHAARASIAVALLKRLGAEAFVHCGDVGGEAVLDALAGTRAWFVWGNTDWADPGLERYAESIGLSLPASMPVRLELGGRKLAVFHGHEPGFGSLVRLMEASDGNARAAQLQGATFVLYGHSHQAASTVHGGVRFVNPGALHRARTYTVATIDLVTDSVEHWVVADDMSPTARPQRYRLAQS